MPERLIMLVSKLSCLIVPNIFVSYFSCIFTLMSMRSCWWTLWRSSGISCAWARVSDIFVSCMSLCKSVLNLYYAYFCQSFVVYLCRCWWDLVDSENPHWGFLKHLLHLDQILGCVQLSSRGEKLAEEKVKFSKPPFNPTADVQVSAWSTLSPNAMSPGLKDMTNSLQHCSSLLR